MADGQPTTADARGYQRLADFMAWEPHCAIFPRFKAANMLNLLSLQAEVCCVLERLKELLNVDDQASNEPSKWAVNWRTLMELDDGQSDKWLTVLELRRKLDAYNAALSQQITLARHPAPLGRDLDHLQQWFAAEDRELRGPGSTVWYTISGDHFDLNDKVILSPDRDLIDNVSVVMMSILERMPRLLTRLPFHRRSFPIRNRNLHTPIPPPSFDVYGSNHQATVIGDNLATIFASLLTTIPIIILNFCRSTNLRLALIVLFTTVFSATLVTFSHAKRSEIFAASAAFAAVQVVFVGTSINGQQ